MKNMTRKHKGDAENMITMLTAFTEEVDDEQVALKEILEQLDLEHNLKKNSVAIVMFHAEFVDTGVVQYVTKQLPIDAVGCTTIYAATPEGDEAMVLSVSVLTSDEASFSVGSCAPVTVEDGQDFRKSYSDMISSRDGETPKMMVQFVPQISILLELTLNAMQEINADIPIFGTVAIDNSPGFVESCAVLNGEITKESINMLAIWGDVKAKFFVETLPEIKTQKFKAKITKSEYNVLKEANGIRLVDYFSSIGLSKDDINAGNLAIPFMIGFNDGTPSVARGINFINDEGYAVSSGLLPEGGTIAVSALDEEVVLDTTDKIFDDILQDTAPKAILAFPCVTRYYMLLADRQDREVALMRNKIGSSAPYHIAYSGGEICPMRNTEGKLINKFHNFSLAVCVFE